MSKFEKARFYRIAYRHNRKRFIENTKEFSGKRDEYAEDLQGDGKIPLEPRNAYTFYVISQMPYMMLNHPDVLCDEFAHILNL